MASGRVDAEPAILKTLQSPQIRGGFTLPLPLPLLRLGHLEVPLEKVIPLENVKQTIVFTTFSHMGAPRIPQGPSKDPQGLLRELPGTPQSPPRPPKAVPKALEGSPRLSQEAANGQNTRKNNSFLMFL